ncbi:AfsR/SARP family transcriptional regulator [Prauserella cavernicola]|uniref:Tetratricopeptide repeat protein n=1 Tax=Prauserella cavernicola TaxID=2800127 RepID=A0A934QWD1_9PSEU|nr:BTAD domain-containing putative transcriptional regulator [Prauserella cavernicola]MBK1786524.1 tetratricopeptide repeat protein [Prauserella cavernicola]
MIRYGVLGPLTVDGETVSPGQQRTVLATLLIQANEAVPTTTLVDELWPDRAPGSATVMVQMCVSSLRKLLAPGVPARDPLQVLRTYRGGYRLDVPGDAFDQARFLALADRGHRLAERRDLDGAADALREALELWRGPALHDVTGGAVVSAHATWLDEQRAAALERRIAVELALGRHSEVIAELRGQVVAEPTQETLAAQLVTALAAAGRQSEAFAVFEQTRLALAEELGVRPGRALREAVRRLRAPAGVEAPTRPAIAPAQLPPDIGDFTGRAELLGEIEREVLSGPDGAPRVLVLCGQGGLGKSALAVRAANALRGHFPDAQVVTGEGSSLDVLGRFLRALGVTDDELPSSLSDRQHLWRSRTANARVLVLVDGARGEQQVRALLPGGSGCAVLVTSRRRLLGLEGAHTVEVPELPETEALDLLAALAGRARLDAEPEQARELVRLCGGLPLAVRIVGAKLAAHAYEPISELVARVADRHRRLGELRAGDLDVRATVDVSYAECPAQHRRALRLLGHAGLPSCTRWTVATLLDCSADTARDVCEGLVEAQLLQVAGRDSVGLVRYRLHDLIAAFAAEQPEPCAGEAMERLVHGYLELAARAHDKLRASRFPPVAAPAPASSAASRAVQSDPGGWRHEEAGNLVALTHWTYASGWWRHAWQLADAFAGLAERRPSDPGVRDVAVLGLLAARRTRDRAAEAMSLCALGDLRWESGRAGVASRYYNLAGAAFEELGDDRGLARVLTARADVDIERGRLDRAREDLRTALLLAQLCGDQECRGDALHQLGSLLADIGDLSAAQDCFTDSRQLAESLGSLGGVARAEKRLADVLRWRGEYDEARALLESAVEIAREQADVHWEAHVLRSLGEVDRATGRLHEADVRLTRACELFTELGHRHARAYALYSLGELYSDQDLPDRAELSLAACQQMFHALDDRRGQAYALLGLGRLWTRHGEKEAAIATLRAASGLFAGLGYRRCEQVAIAAILAAEGPAQDSDLRR